MDHSLMLPQSINSEGYRFASTWAARGCVWTCVHRDAVLRCAKGQEWARSAELTSSKVISS